MTLAILALCVVAGFVVSRPVVRALNAAGIA